MSDPVDQHLDTIRKKLDSQYKEKLQHDKQKILTKLIAKFPDLKEVKEEIEDEIINAPDSEEAPSWLEEEYVLTQWQHQDHTYFRDPLGYLWSLEGEKVGYIKKNQTTQSEKIYLYEDEKLEQELEEDGKLEFKPLTRKK